MPVDAGDVAAVVGVFLDPPAVDEANEDPAEIRFRLPFI